MELFAIEGNSQRGEAKEGEKQRVEEINIIALVDE